MRSLLLAVCMVLSLPASACHCLEPQIADAYARSVAIAMVRIQSLKPTEGGLAAEGEVLSAWKGDLPVMTGFVSLSDCDYPLAQGEYYLLFLERDPAGAITTGRCRGNRERGEAAVSLHWLNRYGRRSSIEYPNGDPPTPWSVRISPNDVQRDGVAAPASANSSAGVSSASGMSSPSGVSSASGMSPASGMSSSSAMPAPAGAQALR